MKIISKENYFNFVRMEIKQTINKIVITLANLIYNILGNSDLNNCKGSDTPIQLI